MFKFRIAKEDDVANSKSDKPALRARKIFAVNGTTSDTFDPPWKVYIPHSSPSFVELRRSERPTIILDRTRGEPTLLMDSGFRVDKRKDGWKLIEDVGFNPPIASIDELEVVGLLTAGESFINSEEMIRRGERELNADLGQMHGEWLLKNQDRIPIEWRCYYLVFSRTTWLDPDGNRRVPILRADDGPWILRFGWLDYGDWGSNGRLVRSRKPV